MSCIRLIRTAAIAGALLVAGLAGGPALAPAGPAWAQPARPAPAARPGSPKDVPRQLAEVGFDQLPGAELPLDLRFTDSRGETVTLGSYFGQRPVLLVPAYYDCPMLCTMVLNGLVASLNELPFAPGEEIEVVVYSFAPGETPEMAAAEKERALARYQGPAGTGPARLGPARQDPASGSTAAATGDGWHFLVGEPEAIARLSEAIGFRYSYDADKGEYAHVSGVVVATPAGKVARYFYGVEFPPRDVRLAMVEAADEKIGSVVDQVLLFCFQYDPTTGKYTALTMNIIRLGGILTVAAIALFITIMLRREHSRHQNSLGTA